MEIMPDELRPSMTAERIREILERRGVRPQRAAELARFYSEWRREQCLT